MVRTKLMNHKLWFRNINLKWNSIWITTLNSPTFSVIFLCSDFKFPDDVKTFIIYLFGYKVSLPRSMLMTDVGDGWCLRQFWDDGHAFEMSMTDSFHWKSHQHERKRRKHSDEILAINILKVIRRSATSFMPVSLKKETVTIP